jgi:ketosteroid isomerase-like protein
MGEANRELVARFWATMATNRWADLAPLLHDAYTLEFPQSGERLRGRDRFIALNAEYPAAGPWRFTVERLVADADVVVSDVAVTDGVITARAISFFEIRDGRIWRMTEYWPDPFPAPPNRAHLTERAGG